MRQYLLLFLLIVLTVVIVLYVVLNENKTKADADTAEESFIGIDKLNFISKPKIRKLGVYVDIIDI